MRGLLRITTVGASSVALILFVMSGAGCNNQKAGSANPAAKSMSGDHDHSAHDHGAAGHEPAAGAAEQVAQKLCPVMDDEIDSQIFTMHNGRKVYFCCDDCIAKFKKDPAKYLAKLDSGR